ncbi:MAG: hypothetical protein ABIE23_05015 [archaeon]|nr:hypothetical protein [Candidatus Micrarchaeota archaeon]
MKEKFVLNKLLLALIVLIIVIGIIFFLLPQESKEKPEDYIPQEGEPLLTPEEEEGLVIEPELPTATSTTKYTDLTTDFSVTDCLGEIDSKNNFVPNSNTPNETEMNKVDLRIEGNTIRFSNYYKVFCKATAIEVKAEIQNQTIFINEFETNDWTKALLKEDSFYCRCPVKINFSVNIPEKGTYRLAVGSPDDETLYDKLIEIK